MRYGLLYSQLSLNDKIVKDCLEKINELEDSKIIGGDAVTNRKSKINFIIDKDILNEYLNLCLHINNKQNYNLDIDALEPLQYSEYHEGNEYGWHVDQTEPRKDNRVRKLSFSIFLNNDYEGGEFDLEIYNPLSKKRYVTFDNRTQKNSILFFYSDFWHRVRPVKKGVRKSIVGWVLGPKYR